MIYFNSPKDLEKFYLTHLHEIKIPIIINDNWIRRVEEDFHSDWLPVKAIKFGIGIHYGPMPKFIQRKIAELFKDATLKNLLSTNSIIEGVNTPTKNIYISTSRNILGDKNLVKYKNLIGRAGRLGEHKVGNIFYNKRHELQFEKANIPYQQIDIEFNIENRAEIIQINREDIFDSTINSDQNIANESSSVSKSYLKHTNYKNVPTLEVGKLLDKHGFTVKQFQIFLDYVGSDKIMFLGIIGKICKNIDIKILNTVLNHRHRSFKEMVDEQYSKNRKIEKSKIISLLIDMIYSVLPFKIIPLVNFTIDINDLYKEYNGVSLLKDEVIREAKSKRAQFYSKFIGIKNPTPESLIIVNKLFEYGIPYQRVKPYLKEITKQLPNKFSIYDIKKIIFENNTMVDLKIYFE